MALDFSQKPRCVVSAPRLPKVRPHSQTSFAFAGVFRALAVGDRDGAIAGDGVTTGVVAAAGVVGTEDAIGDTADPAEERGDVDGERADLRPRPTISAAS